MPGFDGRYDDKLVRFIDNSPTSPIGSPIQGSDRSDRPTVLVTGGAGYIGAHCCRALAAAGYQPVVYDNFSTGHRSFVTGPVVEGGVLDKGTPARAFAPAR